MSWGRNDPPKLPPDSGPGRCFCTLPQCVGMRCVQSPPRREGKRWQINSGCFLAADVFGIFCLWDFLPQREGSAHHWHRLLQHCWLFGVSIARSCLGGGTDIPGGWNKWHWSSCAGFCWVEISMAATWQPKVAQLSCPLAAVTVGAWLWHHSARRAQVRWKGRARQEGQRAPSPSMGTCVLAFYILIILTFNASQLK